MKGKLILIVIVSAVVLIFGMIQISIYLNKDNTAENDLYQFDETEQEEEITSGSGNENDQSSENVAVIDEFDQEVEGEIVDLAEVDPRFPGGEEEMTKFIQQNVVYPELDREMGNEGTVYASFIVTTTGDVKDVKIVKGVSAGLDKEVIRVVRKMPDWIPGEQGGEKVNVRYTIPVKFTIE